MRTFDDMNRDIANLKEEMFINFASILKICSKKKNTIRY